MLQVSNAHDTAAGVQVVATRLLPGQHSSTYQTHHPPSCVHQLCITRGWPTVLGRSRPVRRNSFTATVFSLAPWPGLVVVWWSAELQEGTFIPATTRIDDIKPQNEKLFADPKTGTQLMASLKEEALISLAGLSSDLSCFAWRRIL